LFGNDKNTPLEAGVRLYILLICALIIAVGITGCSNAANVPCEKQADDLDKEYEAIVKERSSDPKRVFTQFNALKQKAERAVKNCPDSIKMHSILSTSFMGLGKNSEALTTAQKALSINPESADANDLFGGALAVLNRFSEALPYIEKAVKLDPGNVHYQLNLCSTYDMAKQYDKAIDSCSKLISKKDDKVLGEALYIRARAYQATGKKQEAAKDFEQAKALGVDLGEYYTPEHLGETQPIAK
jgi:tetratricopeptide (TPR) repeat protein